MECSLCNGVVEAEKFSEHLSDYHAEKRCESRGARVQGAVGLLQHIESSHYSSVLAFLVHAHSVAGRCTIQGSTRRSGR